MKRFYDCAGMTVVDIFEMLIKEQLSPETTITAIHCEQRKKYHHEQIMREEKDTQVVENNINERSLRNPPIEVVFDIVKKYHNKIPIAIASSGWKDHIVAGLTKFNVIQYFDAIVTIDDEDVKRGKPHPDMYIIAAQRLGVDVNDCIGFEDADLGMQSIENATYMYACDVRLFHDYPRNVEKRMVMELQNKRNEDEQKIEPGRVGNDTEELIVTKELKKTEDQKETVDQSFKRDAIFDNNQEVISPLSSGSFDKAPSLSNDRTNPRLANGSSLENGYVSNAPSDDNDNFETAKELAMKAMEKDKEDFFTEDLPLSQKEILQAILLAEDAAISGRSEFNTKDQIHCLDKVHMQSFDEELEEEFFEANQKKSGVNANGANIGIKLRAMKFINGLAHPKRGNIGGLGATAGSPTSQSSQHSDFV